MDTGAVKVACPVLWGGWGSNGLSLPALYPGMIPGTAETRLKLMRFSVDPDDRLRCRSD